MPSHPSHPSAPHSAALSPLLFDLTFNLAPILPSQPSPLGSHPPRHRRASSASIMPDADVVELAPFDRDTSRLLPVRQKRHHVRVQGKLVVVRSISSANMKPGPASPVPELPRGVVSPLVTPGVGGEGGRRGRGSVQGRRRSLDDGGEGGAETEEEVREVVVRDRQLRGYGIGGAGNIRRPTDVANFSSAEKRRWNVREVLGLTSQKVKPKTGI